MADKVEKALTRLTLAILCLAVASLMRPSQIGAWWLLLASAGWLCSGLYAAVKAWAVLTDQDYEQLRKQTKARR
jgi:hypothetical protein